MSRLWDNFTGTFIDAPAPKPEREMPKVHTLESTFDWIEKHATKETDVTLGRAHDGTRFQVILNVTLESDTPDIDRNVRTTVYYRGATLLEAIRLAMVDHP